MKKSKELLRQLGAAAGGALSALLLAGVVVTALAVPQRQPTAAQPAAPAATYVGRMLVKEASASEEVYQHTYLPMIERASPVLSLNFQDGFVLTPGSSVQVTMTCTNCAHGTAEIWLFPYMDAVSRYVGGVPAPSQVTVTKVTWENQFGETKQWSATLFADPGDNGRVVLGLFGVFFPEGDGGIGTGAPLGYVGSPPPPGPPCDSPPCGGGGEDLRHLLQAEMQKVLQK
jgi:hypothetical protein